MSNLDEDTRATVRSGGDLISSYLAHFGSADATFESWGKVSYYLETLRLHLMEALLCVERELQRRVAVEPTDLGT